MNSSYSRNCGVRRYTSCTASACVSVFLVTILLSLMNIEWSCCVALLDCAWVTNETDGWHQPPIDPYADLMTSGSFTHPKSNRVCVANGGARARHDDWRAVVIEYAQVAAVGATVQLQRIIAPDQIAERQNEQQKNQTKCQVEYQVNQWVSHHFVLTVESGVLPAGSIQRKFLAPVTLLDQCWLVGFPDEVVAHHQIVHLRPHEAQVGVGRAFDDWFAAHIE